MNYNKLKSILSEKKITVADFSEQLQMTRQGLQKSLDNGLLPYEKVLLCCQLLSISPNEFYGWEEETSSFGNGNYASHISGGNTQNSNEAIKALKEQLKEKDKQIDRLLRIIEKNKLK